MIFVIAEHDNNQLKPATLNTITAAKKWADEIVVLVAGLNCHAVAENAAKISGVKKVIHADNAAYQHFLAENFADLILSLAKNASAILAPATTFGKNILPRVAGLLNVAQISEVIEIVDSNTFVRPIYAGNALATVQSQDAIKVMTVRSTAFTAAEIVAEQVNIEKCDLVFDHPEVKFIKQELNVSKRPELTAAHVIVSGGRALQSAENFKLLEALADRLNAAIGASRAAVDAGFVPNDYQVGQTGKVVAPQLYIAIGISGAIQHIAGMKDSKVIVAINKDAEAPIFQIADFGLVGDLFEIVPQLTAELDKLGSK